MTRRELKAWCARTRVVLRKSGTHRIPGRLRLARFRLWECFVGLE